MKDKKIVPILWLVVYLLFIFYITIFSRNFSLVQSIRLDLFWSYNAWLDGKAGLGSQILLNIALFVPLGFFLLHVLRRWDVKRPRLWTVLISLMLSGSIEVIQFVDGLGLCELDDVFNNFLGASIGVSISGICVRLDERGQGAWYTKLVMALFLIIGIVGCRLADSIQRNQLYKQFMEYDFAVSNVISNGNTLTLEGYCYAYGRDFDMPRYQIVLKGEKTGKIYNSITTVYGDAFRAIFPVVTDEKLEVDVKFKYYSPVSTLSYINKGRVVDVSGTVTEPDVEETDLSIIVTNGVLKVYEPTYDVYVYQLNNMLYWLIGFPLDKKTTILCTLYINDSDGLPSKRRKINFNVQNFLVGSRNDLTHTMRCGRYKVFYREIPTKYNVAAVLTGFYADKKTQWEKYFRVLKEKTDS